jgi:bifunctional ADP-heptose synthase (sugar kinase/adenylyltransferase)
VFIDATSTSSRYTPPKSSNFDVVAAHMVVAAPCGTDFTINSEVERMRLISLLPQVDYIHLHDEVGYEAVIKLLQPAIYVKGMDTGGADSEDEAEYIAKNPELRYLSPEAGFVLFCDDGSISSSVVIARILSTSAEKSD